MRVGAAADAPLSRASSHGRVAAPRALVLCGLRYQAETSISEILLVLSLPCWFCLCLVIFVFAAKSLHTRDGLAPIQHNVMPYGVASSGWHPPVP